MFTKTMVLFISIIITAVVVSAMAFSASYSEYKSLNNKVCPNCGKPLRYFDTDSQGGEGWTCDNCDYTTWVSYHNLVYRFWPKHSKK